MFFKTYTYMYYNIFLEKKRTFLEAAEKVAKKNSELENKFSNLLFFMLKSTKFTDMSIHYFAILFLLI